MIFKITLIILLFTASAIAGPYRSMIANSIAIVTMKKSDSPDKVPRKDCTVCKGTGKVKAGDGQTIVWRDCDNCYAPQIDIEILSDVKEPCPCGIICPHGDGCKCTAETCECEYWVMFTATWCGPCTHMKRIAGDLFYSVDIDKYPKLKKEFKVTHVPTFVHMKKGYVDRCLVGVQPRQVFE